MPSVVRVALALIAGIAAGVLTMVFIQRFLPFQPPSGVDYASGKPFNNWVGSLPLWAFQVMLAVFLVGAMAGGFVTRLVAPGAADFPLELIVGFILLFYSIVSFQAAPTPPWLTYASCPGCMIFAWLGGWAGRRIRTPIKMSSY